MIIFDLETTGVDVYSAEIITGHFISVNSDHSIKSEYELKCNPVKWSFEAEKVHGITRETASTYLPFKSQANDLMLWINSQEAKEIWQHTNASMFGKLTFFDYSVLKMNMYDYDISSYFNLLKLRPYSTHTLAKILQSRYNFEGLKLNLICKELGIKLTHHDAKSDAYACLEIIKQLRHLVSEEDIIKHERGVTNESEEPSSNNPIKPRKRKSIN